MDDEALEIGRRDACCDPHLHHVSDGLVDVLDTSLSVAADSDWFHDAVVRRQQSVVLHQTVLSADRVLGGRRVSCCRRGGRRSRLVLLPSTGGPERALDGEVVQREVDTLARTSSDHPRVTAAVTVRRI